MSSSQAGAGAGAGAAHSLAFRVMRLCRPSFQVDIPLRFDPADLLFGEDLFDDPTAAPHLPTLLFPSDSDSDLTYRSRFLLSHPSDSVALNSLLLLPQSFGAIYLGETFCSYISISNSSNFEVRDIIIKAEIQTERQRILLLDTSKSPVESIRAGGRYDFIVEHDVKELGAHTLVCTALYIDGDGDRKYLPQFFKFVVANPLSVKTKVRVVKVGCNLVPLKLLAVQPFLEACIENHTKSNLYMDQVDFEPAQHWSSTVLIPDDPYVEDNSSTRDLFKPPVLIKSGGGIHNYLYELKSTAQGPPQMKVEGSNVLGKLQIVWRTNLGEPGRLQTQQILGSPIVRKDIEMQALGLPSVIISEKPFSIRLNLTNQTERVLGPFQVWLSESDALDAKVIMINGIQMMSLEQVEAFGSLEFQLNLIATKHGIQKVTGITVFDTREKKTHESLLELEIFVDSEQAL